MSVKLSLPTPTKLAITTEGIGLPAFVVAELSSPEDKVVYTVPLTTLQVSDLSVNRPVYITSFDLGLSPADALLNFNDGMINLDLFWFVTTGKSITATLGSVKVVSSQAVLGNSIMVGGKVHRLLNQTKVGTTYELTLDKPVSVGGTLPLLDGNQANHKLLIYEGIYEAIRSRIVKLAAAIASVSCSQCKEAEAIDAETKLLTKYMIQYEALAVWSSCNDWELAYETVKCLKKLLPNCSPVSVPVTAPVSKPPVTGTTNLCGCVGR